MTHTLLAARTDFSIGESILTTEKLIAAAVAAGQSVVAVTDTMSITSMIGFTTAAKEAGIRPIIGVRLRLSDNPTWRPGEGQKKKDMPPVYYLTLYARAEEGMKAIFRLLTLANSEERFYYASRLGFDDLYKELDNCAPELLAVVLGDEHGVMAHPDAEAIAWRIGTQVDHVYAPIVPINTPYYGRMNQLSLDLIAKHNVEPILIRPALYEKDTADSQEIMSAITEGNKVTDGWFKSRFSRDLHPMTTGEFTAEVLKCGKHLNARGVKDVGKYLAAAIKNTNEFPSLISYEWKKAEVSLPVMAPDEFIEMTAQCKKGWVERFKAPIFGHLPTPVELRDAYMPRLKYELETLKRLKFAGYFLLVQDIVKFAKESGILVGPGRGSVGGSLVAYLMGITDVDPIRFELMFERFINPDRLDLPDADLDFMSTRRSEIMAYLIKKYGEKHVAGVSNFGTLAAASAMRDVGRVTGIPERDYSVSKLVPKLHGANVPLVDCRAQVPEIDAFAKSQPELWPIMETLEGTIRNMSQHAAGIVIAAVELTDRGVVERRKESSVVCWDKEIVENQGLIKVDVLGLSTLDVMNLAMNYIKERHGVTLDLNTVELDDPDVLENFVHARTTGIFQMESGGMRRLLRELGSSGSITFADITAATALYRPGPMESGMMDSFYLRKQGNEEVSYDHPLMEPILRDTYGVIVYQEQVMKISQTIAGYSGAEADKLRKIMGKKKPEEMKKSSRQFIDGCIATIACTEKWAQDLFDKIAGFAGYGFNASHATAYTLITYQSMWLKTRYPVEFYAAALTLMDADKLPGLLRDAKASGIVVETPNINYSTGRFEIITDTRLSIPFKRIKGISDLTTNAIIEARGAGRFVDTADFLARIEKRRCNVKHQDLLTRIGAFASIEPSQPTAVDPCRTMDLIDLIPGLISANVPIHHDFNADKVSREAIFGLIDEYRTNHGPASADADGMPVKPSFGKTARFMIISDAPGGQEDMGGVMGFSLSNTAVEEAMLEAGLDRSDVYWTAIVKRPKRGKQITPEEIAIYAPYLMREIEILKPPVIVLLGSVTSRHFIKDFKGKAADQAGNIIYSKELDANLVVGFSPGEIYHDPDKQTNMNTVFQSVAELLQ